jgi:tripartite-type tricarboxylate transporter receptor subunit TctC
MGMRLNRFVALACACLSLSFVGATGAQTFPSKPIKLIVGFAPGGSSDTVARLLAPKMGELLKQSIVIDNRPGGGGNIATDALLKSPADGYTILLGTIGSLAVNPYLTKLVYDPVNDTTPLSMAVIFTNVLVVNVNSDIKTFADYVRAGKTQGATLFFGSSGIGSSGHLAGELLKSMTGVNAQHVAYKGGAPATNDLLGGNLTSMFASPTDILQFIESGKLRALASTGTKRLDALPQIPTVAESGYPAFEAANWYAFIAPKGTPPDVAGRLNKAITGALADPAVVAQLKKLGLDPAPMTPEATAAYIRKEYEKWGKVVKDNNIKAE